MSPPSMMGSWRFEKVSTVTQSSIHLSSVNHHSHFDDAPSEHRHDPMAPGKRDTLCPSTLEQLAITYKLPECIEARDALHRKRAQRQERRESRAAESSIAAEPDDDGDSSDEADQPTGLVDGVKLRLLPAFLRIRAIGALRILQAELAPDVFLRGLSLLPNWAGDATLRQRLGI